jgi:hypothetical protein
MLHTWKARIFNEETEEYSDGIGGGVVTPDCCETVQKTLAIIISIPEGRRKKPQWHVTLPTELFMRLRQGVYSWDMPAPTFCPFCATALPEIVKRDNLAKGLKIHKPVSDGDYCGGCEERSRSCRCLFPAAAFMPITERVGG